jgi:hypothetical protein
MAGTETLVQQIEQASGLPALLASGWEAFEFIAKTAPAYDDPDVSGRRYAFMLAASAACRGRNALACAPSLPDDDGTADAEVCVLGDEMQAAVALADLAAVLRQRLAEACARTLRRDDRRAYEAAMAAAAETHALLMEDGDR